MFEDFEKRYIRANGIEHFVVTGGKGPPLLLLHGYPQTHMAFHAIAPILAEHFSLIIPDIRGYGRTRGPAPDSDHENYSKRTMANDAVELMHELGFQKFAVAGHDRGGRTAYRMALDHPGRVTHLVCIDIIPTLVLWERMDQNVAMSTFHWPLLSQPAPLPEKLIANEPHFWVKTLIDRWIGKGNSLNEAALQDYQAQFLNRLTLESTCEDYRAGVTCDIDHDRADRENGHKITCATLVIWGEQFLKSRSGNILQIWNEWSENVVDLPLDCGHFIAEEKPDECATAIIKHMKP